MQAMMETGFDIVYLTPVPAAVPEHPDPHGSDQR